MFQGSGAALNLHNEGKTNHIVRSNITCPLLLLARTYLDLLLSSAFTYAWYIDGVAFTSPGLWTSIIQIYRNLEKKIIK